MPEIDPFELRIDRFISHTPAAGVLAVVDGGAVVQNLVAWDPATGDVTHSAPAGTGANTRIHRFAQGLTIGGNVDVAGSTKFGVGSWPATSIGRTGSRVGLFSDAADGELFLGNMQSGTALNRGAAIYLGARGTTATDNLGFARIASRRETATSGDLSTRILFSVMNAAGVAIDAGQITSAGILNWFFSIGLDIGGYSTTIAQDAQGFWINHNSALRSLGFGTNSRRADLIIFQGGQVGIGNPSNINGAAIGTLVMANQKGIRTANTAGSGTYELITGTPADEVNIGGGAGSINHATAAVFFNNSTTTASAANAFLDGANSNRIYRSTSSLRYKNLLGDYTLGEARLLLLDPAVRVVRFTEKGKAQSREHVGLIAEDVYARDRRFATVDAKGRPDWVQYPHLAAPIIMILRDLDGRVGDIERQRDQRIAA